MRGPPHPVLTPKERSTSPAGLAPSLFWPLRHLAICSTLPSSSPRAGCYSHMNFAGANHLRFDDHLSTCACLRVPPLIAAYGRNDTHTLKMMSVRALTIRAHEPGMNFATRWRSNRAGAKIITQDSTTTKRQFRFPGWIDRVGRRNKIFGFPRRIEILPAGK